jgi:hypothetical protein
MISETSANVYSLVFETKLQLEWPRNSYNLFNLRVMTCTVLYSRSVGSWKCYFLVSKAVLLG